MAVTHIEQLGVKLTDAPVDPGGAPPCARGSAALDYALIGAVDPDLEPVLLDDPGETPGDMHAFQGQNAAPLRLNPIKRWIVRAFGHRKNAAGICFKQHLRRYFDHQA